MDQHETSRTWGISTYKRYISGFSFHGPEVRLILRPNHYRTMGNVQVPFIPKIRERLCYLYQDCLMPGHSRWPICRFDPLTSPSGHYEVIWGQMRVLSLAFDRIEIEQWGLSQCVSRAETHRLICNITYLGHHVTSHDLDLRSNFGLDFLRSTYKCFNASQGEEHDGVGIIPLAFLVQKLFAKNNLSNKSFDLPWSSYPNTVEVSQFWHVSERVAQEL